MYDKNIIRLAKSEDLIQGKRNQFFSKENNAYYKIEVGVGSEKIELLKKEKYCLAKQFLPFKKEEFVVYDDSVIKK